MKINPYQNNNINVNSYKRVASVSTGDLASNSSETTSTGKKDQVSISPEAKQMNETNRIQTERQQKVEDLKNQVQSGQYKIQPRAVAEAFASYWQSIGGGNK